jgi:hypothetical protein
MENTPTQNPVESTQKLKRIDAHYVLHEIQHVLHLEHGYLFTIRELLLRPGKTIRTFLFEDRTKYVKPVIFLIFSAVIFSLIIHFFHVEYSFFNINKIAPLQGKIRAKEIGDWTNSHIGYTNLLIGVFIGCWIKIFFKTFRYNIFEIIVLLCFALGQAILLLGIFMLFASLFNSATLASIGIFCYFGYTIWAIGQFFGEQKPIHYIKSLLAWLLGNASFLITLILIAYFWKQFS